MNAFNVFYTVLIVEIYAWIFAARIWGLDPILVGFGFIAVTLSLILVMLYGFKAFGWLAGILVPVKARQKDHRRPSP